MYTVKELFPTLQGEGAHAGRAAVFCRFAGCNLWSGCEEDRATAVCQFCDTDFIGSVDLAVANLRLQTIWQMPLKLLGEAPRQGLSNGMSSSLVESRFYS